MQRFIDFCECKIIRFVILIFLLHSRVCSIMATCRARWHCANQNKIMDKMMNWSYVLLPCCPSSGCTGKFWCVCCKLCIYPSGGRSGTVAPLPHRSSLPYLHNRYKGTISKINLLKGRVATRLKARRCFGCLRDGWPAAESCPHEVITRRVGRRYQDPVVSLPPNCFCFVIFKQNSTFVTFSLLFLSITVS